MDKAKTKDKTVEEAPVVGPGGNGQQGPQGPQGQGLRAMSENDVNDYMASLLKAQAPPKGFEGIELDVLTRFKGTVRQQDDVDRRLNMAQRQLEELKSLSSKLQGESQGYANLLVSAEDTRRAQA